VIEFTGIRRFLSLGLSSTALFACAGGCLAINSEALVSSASGAERTGSGGAGGGTSAGVTSGEGSSGCLGKPDGSPCALWWEPCVTDAACRAGQCRSSLAEAEVPGSLRWDAGGTSVVGPESVDDAGVSTFLMDFPLSDGGVSFLALYAFDACGRTLWIDHDYEFYSVMSAGAQLIALATHVVPPSEITGHLVALNPLTGTVAWDTTLDTLISEQDSGPPSSFFDFSNPAMSSTGAISLEANFVTADGTPVSLELLTFDRQGREADLRILPLGLGSDPVVDADGTIYLGISQLQQGAEPARWSVWGGTPSGETFFDSNSALEWMWLAAGADLVSGAGAGEVGADGGILYATPDDLSCGPSQVLDVNGVVYEVEVLDAGTEPVIVARSPGGTIKWQSPANGAQSLALSDDWTLFSVTSSFCYSASSPALEVAALDAETGTDLWRVQLSPQVSGTPSLALTPGGTLLTSDDSNVYAVFAGQERPSSTAPWSRDRGSNFNAASALRP
jgi:outer membrane protein assembly factor BamB